MNIHYYKLLLLASLIFLFSCKKEIQPTESSENKSGNIAKSEQEQKFNTFYGHQVQVGDGKMRSFFTISHAGIPQEIGIEMTDGALTGLPSDPAAHPSYVIPLHQKAEASTPFDHIWVNWNVHGHEPEFLFGKPHFDFHFYNISITEREAIDLAASNKMPPPGFMPATYVPTPGGVPQMGKHWIDIAHPVIPGTFTQTMIYGSANHKMIFVEPMITQEFLQSGASFSIPFDQPANVRETNTWYPTVYNIYMDPATRTHYVSLSKFVKR